MNPYLPGQLAVVVHDRVEGLGKICRVVGGENRVFVRLLPTPAAKGVRQSQRKSLDLPNRVAIPELPGRGRRLFQYELPTQAEKRESVVGVKIGVVMRALCGVVMGEEIRIGGVLEQVNFAGAEEGAWRLRQIVHRGGIDQPVSAITPGQARRWPLGKNQEQNHRDNRPPGSTPAGLKFNLHVAPLGLVKTCVFRLRIFASFCANGAVFALFGLQFSFVSGLF
jgi:hypothetical protein